MWQNIQELALRVVVVVLVLFRITCSIQLLPYLTHLRVDLDIEIVKQ